MLRGGCDAGDVAAWLCAVLRLLWFLLNGSMDSALAVELPQEQEAALQRLWARRLASAAVPLAHAHADEPGLLDDLLPAEQEEQLVAAKPQPQPQPCACQQPAALDLQEQEAETEAEARQVWEEHEATRRRAAREPALLLDAGQLGDLPARYRVPALPPHELPVVGVWVHPRVLPGFRYRVRPLDDERGRHLFAARALTLQSIGRGYSRRLTFEADPGCLNANDNYLWSDSRPQGLAFELEVVSIGDEFTLHDANHVVVGSVEVLQIQSPQEEVKHRMLGDGSVEKTVQVQLLCKVEWFADEQTPVIVPVSVAARYCALPRPRLWLGSQGRGSCVQVMGSAVVVRARAGLQAVVKRVVHVCVGVHQRRGFTLTPGVSDTCRHTTVKGEDIGDVPTRYTVTGLESYELPVIGTYVDSRITPGFSYRVRPAGSRRPLFGGQSLRLAAIGMGYGKRITFVPDLGSLNVPNNYLWSDSHPDGLGFEPRAVHAGMRFAVMADEQILGEATVFRADAAQQEERHEIERGPQGCTVVKYIHVDVTCHVTMDSAHDGSKLDTHTMRVSGTAVVVRPAGSGAARLVRVESVGLESQLNLLFVAQHSSLQFRPLQASAVFTG